MIYRKPAATTASELLDEMQRAKVEVKVVENDQTRVIAKFKMPDDALPDFEEERPTKPGKKDAAQNTAQNEAPSVIPRHKDSEPPELDDAEILDAIAPAVIIPSLPEPSVEISGMVQKKVHVDSLPVPAEPEVIAPDAIAERQALPEMPMPSLPPLPIARWPKIVLAILTPAAIIVTALALLRYLGVPI